MSQPKRVQVIWVLWTVANLFLLHSNDSGKIIEGGNANLKYINLATM